MKTENLSCRAGFGSTVFLLILMSARAQTATNSASTHAGEQAPAIPAEQNSTPASSPPAASETQPVPAANRDSSNDLSVTVGKAVIVDLAKPVTRILVGLGGFAEALPASPTQVVVTGKATGATTMILWDQAGGRIFFNITVHSPLLEALHRQLQMELPGQHVNVTMEGSNIYLRGTVKDLNSSNRAAMIAGTMGKVVNLLNVKVPPAAAQILLKVRFASVDRSKEKQLGLNVFSSGKMVSSSSTGEFSQPSVSTTATTVSNDLNLFLYDPGLDIGATIQALETRGLAESLAEPNILAENGKVASFLAGGEYPYPMVQGTGSGGSAITIAFKEYGIRLNFIPTITPRGTIQLQVAPEVSALDYGDAVTISGSTEPAITERRVKTEVELADRQSFAIGGLLDNTENETFEKIPFIGDIPVIGKFFQSMTKTKNNSELIVIVTPEIVQPVPAGISIPAPKYPEAFLPSNSNSAMHTPDAEGAGPATSAQPDSIPVEQLIESMNQSAQLNDSGASANSGSIPVSSNSPQR